MNQEKQEKRNKQTGMLVSVGVHLGLLILFFFLLAWREPNPPLPEYGIELDFGMSDVGSGEEATETPAEPAEEVAEAPETTETEVEETVEETVEEVVEEVIEETVTETEAAEPVPNNPLPSPDVVEEIKEEKKPEPVEEKPVEKPKPVKPKPSVNENALFKPGGGSGEGDDVDQPGDKGDPEGLDARGQYTGTAGGGGGGPKLNIAGWNWESPPNKRDKSDQSGNIVFEFWIDEYGVVINVRPISSGVTPEVMKFYEDQLYSTTFIQTNDVTPEPRTKGTVTFKIRSN